jgi:hypothetical protein
MRFSSIIALLIAVVSAAPATGTRAQGQKVAASVPQLERLFAAVPTVDAALATKFPQLAKDGKVDTQLMRWLPGDLIGAGVDLLLGVPAALIDTVGGGLLSLPGNLLGFVGDLLGGSYFDDGYYGYGY